MNESLHEKLNNLDNLAANTSFDTLTPDEYIQIDILNQELLHSNNFKQISSQYTEVINKHTLIFLLTIITLKKNRNISPNLFPDIKALVTSIGTTLTRLSCTSQFFFPSLDDLLNIFLKLPYICADNGMEALDRKLYFRTLFSMLLKGKLFVELNIIPKVSLLKLNKLLIEAMTVDDLDVVRYYEDSIYYEDFLDALFNIQICENNFVLMLAIYGNINTSVISFDGKTFGKRIYRYIGKNRNMFNPILISGNTDLVEFYINSIIINLKDNFDGLDITTFYIYCLSLYIYLQSGGGEHLQEILANQGVILTKLVNKDMRKIYFLFSQFLKEFVYKRLGGVDETDKEVKIEDIVSDEERLLFNFESVYEKLKENKLYMNDVARMLGDKYGYVPLVKEKKTKPEKITKYKSIKFQKKYGVYEKGTLLPTLEVKEEDVKLKVKLNGKFSFLKIHLDQEDDTSDLNPLTKPLHIKDCILGINSEYPDRQKLSLEALPDIILSNPFDLDYHLDSLSETVLKATNTFDLDGFDEMVELVLVKLVIYSSAKMTQILCKRFFLEECSLKQKYQILTVFEKAAEELSEYYSSSKKPYQNKLHQYLEFIIFPLLHYLKSKDIAKMIHIKEFDFLLGKFIMVISKLIKFSENHPLMYKAIFESFDLFKTISLLKDTSQLIQEALIYYTSVLSRFLTHGTFLEVYPEFIPNFRYILEYLNTQMDSVQNDGLRLDIVRTLDTYITNIDKLKDSFNILNKDLLI
jgi:hypothetical protein